MVQGLTEFLPVSSSGHLVLGKKVLGVTTEMPVTFEVVVHLGTLLATLIVFWRPVWEVIEFVFRGAWQKPTGNDSKSADTGLIQRWWNDPAGRLCILVVVGTIPAGVAGVAFKDAIEAMFSSTLLVGIALIVTGTALFLTRWTSAGGRDMGNLSMGRGLLVGIAQAVAIVPGISRSGSTISTALFCGIERETAARFSFLLSMPAIAGAAVLKARDIGEAAVEAGTLPLILGFLSSLIVGLLALKVLLAFVRLGRLHWFSWYCWLIGVLAIVFALTKRGT